LISKVPSLSFPPRTGWTCTLTSLSFHLDIAGIKPPALDSLERDARTLVGREGGALGALLVVAALTIPRVAVAFLVVLLASFPVIVVEWCRGRQALGHGRRLRSERLVQLLEVVNAR